MRRHLFVLMLVLAVPALGIAPKDGAPRLAKVVSRTCERTVNVQGRLKASQSFRGYAPLDATLVALVPEGTRVKKGDTVARLDVTDLADKLRDRTINRDIAAADLAIKDVDYALEGFEVANRVAFAQTELEVAKLAAELTETGIDVPELVRHTKTLEANEALRANLVKSIAQMRPHVPRGFVSRDDLDKSETRLATEEMAAHVTALERSIVTSGALADARAKAVRDMELAASALELARIKQATFETRRTDGLADVSAKVAALDEEIAAYTAQVDRGSLRSPVDGVVIHGFVRSNTGQEKPRVGTKLWRGSLFLEVVQPGKVALEIKVPESDAALLAPGQNVHFVADALPGRQFEARVTRVGATVSGGQYARWVFPDIRRLDVVADVVAGDPGLLPEMTVSAQIVVESRPDTPCVELAAVAGGQVTRADGTVTQVKTGRVFGPEIQVVSGLAAGDEVLVPTELAAQPRENQDTIAVVEKDLELTLADTGTLEPVDVHEIFLPELDGEASITMIAAEGVAVKKGEIIATIDVETAEAKLKERTLERTVAAKDREVAVEQGKADLASLTQALGVAKIEEQVASLDETITNLGKKPREIDDLKRDLAIQRADIGLVARKLELKGQLSGKGYVSAEEVKNLRQDLMNKQVTLEVALAKFELARAGALPLDRKKAAANHLKATLNAELAARKVRSRETKRDLEVRKAELGIQKAQAQVTRLERVIASLTVKAATDGTMMRSELWSTEGLRKYREGDAVREGTVFAKLADLNRFEARGVVTEDHRQSVKRGQKVRFWLSSFAADKHEGEISMLSYVARSRNARSIFDDGESQVFDLSIATREHPARFQPGVSVNYEISIGRVKRALVVPLRSLHFDADGPFVSMTSGERRRVKLGDEEKGEVQITAGLAKGEEILVPRDDR